MEHDRTMEVCVAHETVPEVFAKEIAEGVVATSADEVVVVVVVAHGNVIEVVVHSVDVVEVDAVDVVDDSH